MFEESAQYTVWASFGFVLILAMSSKNSSAFHENGNLVALCMTTTVTVLQIFNNQLKQPPFLSFFSFFIRLL